MSLQTAHLQYQYPGGTPLSFPDIQLEENSNLLILGASGIGKSTLLHLLGGLLKPTSGEVSVKGQNLNKLSEKKLDKFRGKNIGLIFQRSIFIKALNTGSNLMLAQKLAGNPMDSKSAKQLLVKLNISDKWNKLPLQLSIGEQQRLSIARALINKPALILADEPTSALDDQNAKQVSELLKLTADEAGANLVIVTHDQRLKNEFTNHLELSA